MKCFADDASGKFGKPNAVGMLMLEEEDYGK